MEKKQMEKMQEEAKIKLNEYYNKKAMGIVVRDFKMKKLKKALLTTKLVSMLLIGGIAGEKIGEKVNQPQTESSVYEQMDTTSLSEASDEVIIAYVGSSFLDFEKYVGQGDTPATQELVDSVKDSYYVPVMRAYSDYEETKDESYYDEFKKNVRAYENRVTDFSPSFGFNKSIYKYAKSIDGEVCVPYTGIIDDSTIPSNAHVVDRVVYVPVNTLSDEEAMKLGNE